MSQVGQEEQTLGQSSIGRRAEDLLTHVAGVQKMVAEIGKLGSNNVEDVAEGVEAFLAVQRQFEESMREPLNEVEIARRAERFADFIAQVKGTQATEQAVAGVFESRPAYQPWTPEQGGQFTKLLKDKGVIPPATSAQTPLVGGTPVVGK